MQLYQYLPTASESCNLKATAPVVGQAKTTVAVGAGATIADLLPALTTGSVPYAAGQVENKGCADVQLTISYLDGADCNTCTVDSLAVVDVTVLVPANALYPLPTGLVTRIQYQTGTVDGSGVFTASNVAIAQPISWYSFYTPCCNSVLVP